MHTNYKVKTKTTTYFASITIYSKLLHKVFFGGKKKCIVISVYQDGTHPNIDTLSTSRFCDTQGSLQPGTGTIAMIKAAVAFVHSVYPYLKGCDFEFIDKSYVDCMSGYRQQLPSLYMVHHGKTWYEAKFQAFPADKKEEYENHKDKLQKHLKTPLPTWTDFLKTYTISKLHQKILHPWFIQSATWIEFIQRLKSEGFDCYVYKDWLNSFVSNHIPGLYGKSWKISSRDMPLPGIEIQKLSSKPSDMFGGSEDSDDLVLPQHAI